MSTGSTLLYVHVERGVPDPVIREVIRRAAVVVGLLPRDEAASDAAYAAYQGWRGEDNDQ